jgi:hypothetical protein
MITPEEQGFLDRVFNDAHSGEHLDEAKWATGVVLLTHVLLNKDELEREKRINGLWRELRDALAGIPKIRGRVAVTPPPWDPIEDCTQWQCNPAAFPGGANDPEVTDGPLN